MQEVNHWIDPVIVEDMLECSRMAEGAKKTTRYLVRLYADFLEERSVPFEAACSDDVRLFYDHARSRYSEQTARKALNAAKRLHRWVGEPESDKVGHDLATASRTAGEGVRLALAPEKARLILNACETVREAAVIGLLLEGAMKPHEVCAANVGDVTFIDQHAVLLVRATKVRPESLLLIPRAPAAKLRSYLEGRGVCSPDDPLFVADSNRCAGQRLSTRSINGIVNSVFSRSGIEGPAGKYDLRKTGLLLARDQGATDDELMRFARARSMTPLKDLGNRSRYFGNTPQERLSRTLRGFEPNERSAAIRVSALRERLRGLGGDDVVVITIDGGGKLSIDVLSDGGSG